MVHPTNKFNWDDYWAGKWGQGQRARVRVAGIAVSTTHDENMTRQRATEIAGSLERSRTVAQSAAVALLIVGCACDDLKYASVWKDLFAIGLTNGYVDYQGEINLTDDGVVCSATPIEVEAVRLSN